MFLKELVVAKLDGNWIWNNVITEMIQKSLQFNSTLAQNLILKMLWLF